MWALDNRTAYGAERNWIRDRDGAHRWLVAVRATFDVDASGRLKLADEQPPPLLEPAFRGDPAKTSLLHDSDLLSVKPATDVLVDGSAHAPKGRPATTVPVSLQIANVEKTLVVHGTRVYYTGVAGLTATPARPFLTQPIQYECAYGGADTAHPDARKHRIDLRNPVGKGVAIRPKDLENTPAHAVEYPSGSPAQRGPAGFGPVASFWSPRLELAGTYDEKWEKLRKPLLPADYDERFALSAPADQRLAQPLRGGETLTVVNMTESGVLRIELPKIRLGLVTRFGQRTEEQPASLSTVFLATDEKKLSLTWQSALRVAPRDVDYLDGTRVVEKEQLR